MGIWDAWGFGVVVGVGQRSIFESNIYCSLRGRWSEIAVEYRHHCPQTASKFEDDHRAHFDSRAYGFHLKMQHTVPG